MPTLGLTWSLASTAYPASFPYRVSHTASAVVNQTLLHSSLVGNQNMTSAVYTSLPVCSVWLLRRPDVLIKAQGRGRTLAGKASSETEEAFEGYQTLGAKHTAELEVKKSRFISTAWPATSAAQALQLVQECQDPAASHNCYAYKVGERFRSSDDGEPGGTAGRPILGAIEGEGLDGVCVLVTRYFGGTKLGPGGLVRAYAGAARECLRQAPKAWVKPLVEVQMEVPFDSIGKVYQLADQHSAERISESYEEPGKICLRVRVEQAMLQKLNAGLQDATSGTVIAEQY